MCREFWPYSPDPFCKGLGTRNYLGNKRRKVKLTHSSFDGGQVGQHFSVLNHFVKHIKTIYKRVKFNSRKQEQGISVDKFIVDLFAMAEFCEYGILWEEMIRDRIVVGIWNEQLAEKLQLDADLTLEKAVTLVRPSEAVMKQQNKVWERNVKRPTAEVNEASKHRQKYQQRSQVTLETRKEYSTSMLWKEPSPKVTIFSTRSNV